MLQYSIGTERLYGAVGSTSISMQAYSGGGRGSTKGMERLDMRHWSTEKKAPAQFTAKSRGGPLPPGMYFVTYLGRYKHFGRAARLDQTLSSLIQPDDQSLLGFHVTDRSGFLIHGPGPKGSDGCIVPATREDLNLLMDALAKLKDPLPLMVHTPGIPSRVFEPMEAMSHMA